MKICFVCGEYPPSLHGGVGVATRVMGQALVREGHQVRVIGICKPADTQPVRQDDQGVEVHRLHPGSGKFATWIARVQLYRQIRKWALAGEIDLVEVPDVAGMAAGWPPLPVPVIVRLHGSLSYFQAEEGRQPGRLLRILEGAGLRRADFLASTSRYTAGKTEALFGLGDRKQAEVLFNVVDPAPGFAPHLREPHRVMYSGTLVRKKGVISLLKAWPAVLARVPGAHLDVYGKDGKHPDTGGSMRAYLESLLPAGAAPSVTFHGHVARERVIDALKTASCAVFPSYAEAFSLAPLESMALGCPTIGSTRHSGPELITPGVDGLLADPDDIAGISSAVVRLLEDRPFARQMAEAGWRSVDQRFSLRVLLPRNERFYQRCIERFQGKSEAVTAAPVKNGNASN